MDAALRKAANVVVAQQAARVLEEGGAQLQQQQEEQQKQQQQQQAGLGNRAPDPCLPVGYVGGSDNMRLLSRAAPVVLEMRRA